MKKSIHLLLSVLLPFSFLISACGDDDPTPPANTCSIQQQLTFQTDSVTWSAASFSTSLFFGNDPLTGVTGRRCDIQATDADGNKFIIAFTNPNTTDDVCMETGDYIDIDNFANQDDNVVTFSYRPSGGFEYVITEGTLNLTTCVAGSPRTMTGVFSFDGSDTPNDILGTNGQFSVCVE